MWKSYQRQEIRKKNCYENKFKKSTVNSIESKISEALINNETSHEDFMTIINEEKNIEN